jgi:FKBP-type peptidyl-prolyl cis-trans isomerase SlyD
LFRTLVDEKGNHRYTLSWWVPINPRFFVSKEYKSTMPPNKIEKDVVVTLQYKLSLDDGEVVEESTADEPLVYLHGHDNIIPGLERELEGLRVGDRKAVIVEPADAYGDYDPDEVDELGMDELPPGFEPEVGMLLSVQDEEGNEFIAQVTEVTKDSCDP